MDRAEQRSLRTIRSIEIYLPSETYIGFAWEVYRFGMKGIYVSLERYIPFNLPLWCEVTKEIVEL